LPSKAQALQTVLHVYLQPSAGLGFSDNCIGSRRNGHRRCAVEQQGQPIGRSLNDMRLADIAARSRPILDNDCVPN
jgi:hypothetical protein